MNLRSLLAGHTRETAIEAAYYAVRELKQSSVPREVRKAHFSDASESEPSSDAQALAASIVRLIESIEGSSIDDMTRQKRSDYVSELATIAQELTASTHEQDVGAHLLEELRRE
jgi:hypothetical protein